MKRISLPLLTTALLAAPPVFASGNDKVQLSLSGQVNRVLLYVDDGGADGTYFVDNDNSSTRFRLNGEADVTDDVTIGAMIEAEMESNSSSKVSQEDESGVGGMSFTERKLELYVKSEDFGTLFLGQGDTASNGVSEVDLSGTSVAGYSSISDFAGGFIMRDSGTGALTGPKIGAVFSNLDGLSRDDRIRYDTPSLAGFTLSTSAAADERWDAALRYAGEIGGITVKAAGAYANRQDDIQRINGSASALHAASGLSLTAAAGTDERDDRDPMFYYAKLGWQANLIEFGKTAIAVDYYSADDIGELGGESHAYGFQLVQNVDKAATELYLGVRQHKYDAPGEDYDDVFAVMGGARLKF